MSIFSGSIVRIQRDSRWSQGWKASNSRAGPLCGVETRPGAGKFCRNLVDRAVAGAMWTVVLVLCGLLHWCYVDCCTGAIWTVALVLYGLLHWCYIDCCTDVSLNHRLLLHSATWKEWSLFKLEEYSCIDCCNTILGLPDMSSLLLWLVMNAAACFLADLGPRDHVSQTIRELHWLPIRQRMDSKLGTTMHAIVQGIAPDYMCNKITPDTDLPSRSQLRSVVRGLFHVPRIRTRHASRASGTINFKKQLKTQFDLIYNVWVKLRQFQISFNCKGPLFNFESPAEHFDLWIFCIGMINVSNINILIKINPAELAYHSESIHRTSIYCLNAAALVLQPWSGSHSSGSIESLDDLSQWTKP